MKLLIAGSRSITQFDFDGHIPVDVDTIISGGAVGVDTLAEKYAYKHDIEKIIVRPQYSRYGKAAPIKRNQEMVDMCDEVLVIWDGVSRGTKSTVNYANKIGKKVTIIEVKSEN